MRSSRMPISLLIAAVDPEPQKITRSSAVPPTASRIISRASSRSLVVRSPVPELSVWVFAYHGSTASRIKSSMKSSDLPDAV